MEPAHGKNGAQGCAPMCFANEASVLLTGAAKAMFVTEPAGLEP
jgi:hypothetical protein